MKRRTAILRAVLAPSHMLVMDEPFTGLDEALKLEVIRYILKNRWNRFLLITTHQEEDVASLAESGYSWIKSCLSGLGRLIRIKGRIKGA